VLLCLEEDGSGEKKIGRGFVIRLAQLLLNPLGLKPNKSINPINRLLWPCGEDNYRRCKELPLPAELREGEWKKEGARGPQINLEAGLKLLAKEDWKQLRDSSKGEGDALPSSKGKKPLNEPDK